MVRGTGYAWLLLLLLRVCPALLCRGRPRAVCRWAPPAVPPLLLLLLEFAAESLLRPPLQQMGCVHARNTQHAEDPLAKIKHYLWLSSIFWW